MTTGAELELAYQVVELVELGDELAAALGHVLAHGRHERGCDDCDRGRAVLEAWLQRGES